MMGSRAIKASAEANQVLPPDDFGLSDPDTALARFILDLRSRGLRDPTLLGAFERTPRANFLPRHQVGLLYATYSLPIDCGQEATASHVIASALAGLGIKQGLKVLEIGTGSGFQAAIMARMGCEVVTVERFATLHLSAARAMMRLQVGKVQLEHADGSEGFEAGAPYDRIIVNAAMRDVPDALIEQLAPGGTLVIPIQQGREQRLYAFDDTIETYRQRDLGRFSYQSLMPGRARAL